MDQRKLECAIGYNFRNATLLKEALTHPSENPSFNYERLEFLGDAVLELAVSEKLFVKYPSMSEGKLTKSRSDAVRGESLVNVAKRTGLADYIILGDSIKQPASELPSVLENVTEAVFGAVFLDSDFETAKRVILSLVDTDDRPQTDWKSKLQEYLQKKKITDFEYRIENESGPDHAKVFEMSVYINGREYGRGQGNTKKSAEQKAAETAYKNLK